MEVANANHASNIEEFLIGLTAGQSRGLPVGPFPSILLAEACLNDVDSFLLRKGYSHVRYVDDFRIFCESEYNAVKALHDLSEYLFTAHRFSLQPLKTRIVPKYKAIDEFTDPEAEELRGKAGKINEAIEQLAEDFGPYSDLDDLEDEIDEAEIALENLSELFALSLEQPTLNLGLARHLLRRATRLRTAVICPSVFRNLEKLLPVFREVAYYVKATKKSSRQHAEKLIQLLEDSAYCSIPFVKLWGIWILCECNELTTSQKALNLAESSSATLGIRPAALVARSYGLLDWVRERKETWANHGPWDRRAIIYAASVLPRDERNAWLDKVADSGEPLERATAQFVREEGARRMTKKVKKKSGNVASARKKRPGS